MSPFDRFTLLLTAIAIAAQVFDTWWGKKK